MLGEEARNKEQEGLLNNNREQPPNILSQFCFIQNDLSYWSCSKYLISLGLLALLFDLVIGLLENWPSKPLSKLDNNTSDMIDVILGTIPFSLMLLECLILFLIKKYIPLQTPRPTASERLHLAIQEIENHSSEIQQYIQLDEEAAIDTTLNVADLREINNELTQRQSNDRSDEIFNSVAIRLFLLLRFVGYLLFSRHREIPALALSFFGDGTYSFFAFLAKVGHKGIQKCVQYRNSERYRFLNASTGIRSDFQENTGSNRATIPESQQEVTNVDRRNIVETPSLN